MCRDRYIYLLRQWRVKNFKDIFAKIWGQSIKGSCKEMQCWSLECSAMKIPRRKWIKVNYVDFSERMRTLVEKGDCHLVSLLSALLTLAIVLPWSSPWIKMITMIILLAKLPFLDDVYLPRRAAAWEWQSSKSSWLRPSTPALSSHCLLQALSCKNYLKWSQWWEFW